MKNIVLLIAIVAVSIGIGYTANIYLQGQNGNATKKALADVQEQNVILKSKITDLTKEKAKMLIDSRPTPIPVLTKAQAKTVTITYLKRSYSETEDIVEVTLSGDDQIKFDAADIIFSIPNTITVSSVQKGSSFPIYPRLLSSTTSVTITGAAIPQGTSFTYGVPNQIVASFIITKTSRGTIVLDKMNSQVLSGGKNLLDVETSLKELSL